MRGVTTTIDGHGRPIAIQYHRLSREEQAEGHGLERQRLAGDTWCDRNRIDVDLRLEDIGYSAFSADHIRRGEMGRLLRAIEDGRVGPGSTIVLENLDRLTRQDAFEAIGLFTSIVRKDVAIVTTCDGYRYTRAGTAMEKMMTVVMSVMHIGRGNSESEIKSDRVSEAWKKKHSQARESKVPHGRRCPAWIELKPGGYELVRKRADVVRWMCERSAAGWGRRKIVKDLVARDVRPWQAPTPKRPDPIWNESYVQKILTGGEACGTYHPSTLTEGGSRRAEDAIENYYPAAVDRELYERSRAAALSRRGGGGRKGEFTNLFQNLCRCGSCGQGMTLENKGSRSSGPKLVCRRALVGGCDHRFRYDYSLAELTVIFGVGAHADELIRATKTRGDDIRERLTSKQAARRDVEERLRRLVRRMEESDDEALDDALRERRAEARKLDAAIVELGRELGEVQRTSGSASPHAFMGFYDRLRTVPEIERPSARNQVNQALRSIVRRIVFAGGKLTTDFVDGRSAWADVTAERSPRPRRMKSTSVPEANGVS